MSKTQSKKSTAIDKLIFAAKESGVERGQLERFLKHGYVPLPWQLKYHGVAREADKDGGPVDIGVGGARGPGKSHCTFAQLTLDDCQRVKGLKALFLRQTGKSAEESFQDLIDNVLKRRIPYKYQTGKTTLSFKNGSRVILGGFENEKDIDKYTGIQYDVIVVEERNQLTGGKITKLQGSLRTNKEEWRARMYSSFNPGNIGHADVKRTFVDPFRAGQETTTRFIPSTYKDNLFLKPEYIEYLNSIPDESLRKAWRDGSWDVFEGQYFTEWDFNRHTCTPFPIPESWKRYRAYDHGRTNPACMKWYAVDYDGTVWVYRELYVKGMNVDQIAREVNILSHGETYEYSIADPSIFARTGFVDKSGGQTIAESFVRHGITFIPASNRRVDGWELMHKYLHWTDEKKPRIIYFNTCRDSTRTIPLLIHDTIRPEDVDTKGEDHAADTDRYLLASLHETRTRRPKTSVEKRLDSMKQARGESLTPHTLGGFYEGQYNRQ